MKKPKVNQYTDNGDGTVTDNRTGLMWVRDGKSAGCNNGKIMTWKDAMKFCKELDFAEYKGWRLPTIEELQSIVAYEKHNSAIDEAFENTKNSYYWSSTTYASGTGYAWGVNFYSGNVNYYNKTGYDYVRPVRGGQ